ncbi:MAG: ribonuclease domain-containing protein [Nocardioides sp.]
MPALTGRRSWVGPLADLPPEAGHTLDLIDAGGPYSHGQDGGAFLNREQILPNQPEGYYREYTVRTPASDDRGARRIVTGDGGEYSWTDDHYASFARIER